MHSLNLLVNYKEVRLSTIEMKLDKDEYDSYDVDFSEQTLMPYIQLYTTDGTYLPFEYVESTFSKYASIKYVITDNSNPDETQKTTVDARLCN